MSAKYMVMGDVGAVGLARDTAFLPFFGTHTRHRAEAIVKHLENKFPDTKFKIEDFDTSDRDMVKVLRMQLEDTVDGDLGMQIAREALKVHRELGDEAASDPGATEGAGDTSGNAEMNQPGKASGDASVSEPTGFHGAAELADVLEVHPSRKSAFIKQLERKRTKLGSDSWRQVGDQQMTSLQYVYRAESKAIRDLALDYLRPKPA